MKKAKKHMYINTDYRRIYGGSCITPGMVKLEGTRTSYKLPTIKPVKFTSSRNIFQATSTENGNKPKPKILIKPTIPSLSKKIASAKSIRKVIPHLNSLQEIKTVSTISQDPQTNRLERTPNTISQPEIINQKPKTESSKTSRKISVSKILDEFSPTSAYKRRLPRSTFKMCPQSNKKEYKLNPSGASSFVNSNLASKRRSSAENYNKEDSVKQLTQSQREEQQNGVNISEFQLLETIGVGCFGRVKLAKWLTVCNKPCAIKIVDKEYAVKLKQVEHLIQEKNLLNSLENPFIVKWYFFKMGMNEKKVIILFKIKIMFILLWSIFQAVKYIM